MYRFFIRIFLAFLLVFTSVLYANTATLTVNVDNQTKDSYKITKFQTDGSATGFIQQISPGVTVTIGHITYTVWVQLGLGKTPSYVTSFTLVPIASSNVELNTCDLGFATYPVYEAFEANKVNVNHPYYTENCALTVKGNTLTITLTNKYKQ